MREFIYDGKVIARHIVLDDFKEGLNFFSKEQEYLQVGVWCYNSDKELLSHVHNKVERCIQRTYEVLYIIQGSLEASIYSLCGEKIETFTVEQGELLILMECGHGYRILQDDTYVVEVKNGPYMGATIDRTRL